MRRGISSALGCHSCCTRLKRTHQIGSGTDDVPARGGIIEPSLLEALFVAIKAATARLLDGAGISRRLYAFPACFLGPKDFCQPGEPKGGHLFLSLSLQEVYWNSISFVGMWSEALSKPF